LPCPPHRLGSFRRSEFLPVLDLGSHILLLNKKTGSLQTYLATEELCLNEDVVILLKRCFGNLEFVKLFNVREIVISIVLVPPIAFGIFVPFSGRTRRYRLRQTRNRRIDCCLYSTRRLFSCACFLVHNHPNAVFCAHFRF
jgi:hypothetical protein